MKNEQDLRKQIDRLRELAAIPMQQLVLAKSDLRHAKMRHEVATARLKDFLLDHKISLHERLYAWIEYCDKSELDIGCIRECAPTIHKDLTESMQSDYGFVQKYMNVSLLDHYQDAIRLLLDSLDEDDPDWDFAYRVCQEMIVLGASHIYMDW